MGKPLISTGFIALLLVSWVGQPAIGQELASQPGTINISSPHSGDYFQAEIDILNQTFSSLKVIKFFDDDFKAIFFSTLLLHTQVAKAIPQEINAARKKLLLARLYPSHEFS